MLVLFGLFVAALIAAASISDGRPERATAVMKEVAWARYQGSEVSMVR